MITVADGQAFLLTTHTPLDRNGSSTANRFDPNITIRDLEGNIVAQDDNSAADGRNAGVVLDSAGEYTVEIHGEHGGDYALTAVSLPTSAVVGRHLTYRESEFGPSSIAFDKVPLKNGETASIQNISSYVKGINGLVLDMFLPPDAAALSFNDFEFRTGNQGPAETWDLAAVPVSIDVVGDAGLAGSTRVTISWEDGAVQKHLAAGHGQGDRRDRIGSARCFLFR